MELIRICLVGVFLLWEGICDLRKKKISVKCAVVFGIIGLFLDFFELKECWPSLLGGLLIGIVILVLSKITDEKIGYGDGYVLTVTGILLGFRWNLTLLFMSLWLAAIVSVVLLFLKKAKKKTELPFVSFMMPGYILLLTMMMR